jgi:hypothetical protein
MNPQQEFTITKTLTGMLTGMLNGLLEALKVQEAELRPRAIAYQRTALDARALNTLRNVAVANGRDPGWTEQRYWLYIEAGYPVQAAFDEVCAQLEVA